jgi:hypothetical protein
MPTAPEGPKFDIHRNKSDLFNKLPYVVKVTPPDKKFPKEVIIPYHFLHQIELAMERAWREGLAVGAGLITKG